MVRMRCRIAEEDGPAAALEKLRAALEEHLPDPEERGFVEPRLAQLLGLAEHEAREQAGPLRRVAAVLRAPRRRLSDRPRPSRTCSGRTRACSTLSSTCSSGRSNSPAVRDHARTAGAGRAAARPGAQAIATSPPSTSSRCPKARWRSCSPGSCRACPTAPAGRSSARAEGVPLYAVETVRMLLDRGLLAQKGSVYRPVSDDRRARGAGDAAGADRGPPRRPLGRGAPAAPGRRRPRQDLHPRRRWRALSGISPRTSSSRCSPRSSARRCSGCRPTPARPSTASTGSSRTSSAMSRTRRSRSTSGGPATWRRRRTSSQAFPDEDEIAEVIAAHYLDAYEAHPRGRRRRRGAGEGARGARSRGRASGVACRRAARHSATSRRPPG